MSYVIKDHDDNYLVNVCLEAGQLSWELTCCQTMAYKFENKEDALVLCQFLMEIYDFDCDLRVISLIKKENNQPKTASTIYH